MFNIARLQWPDSFEDQSCRGVRTSSKRSVDLWLAVVVNATFPTSPPNSGFGRSTFHRRGNPTEKKTACSNHIAWKSRIKLHFWFEMQISKTCQNHINFCACFPKTSQAYALVGDDGRDSFGREALDTLIKLVEDWISIQTWNRMIGWLRSIERFWKIDDVDVHILGLMRILYAHVWSLLILKEPDWSLLSSWACRTIDKTWWSFSQATVQRWPDWCLATRCEKFLGQE